MNVYVCACVGDWRIVWQLTRFYIAAVVVCFRPAAICVRLPNYFCILFKFIVSFCLLDNKMKMNLDGLNERCGEWPKIV